MNDDVDKCKHNKTVQEECLDCHWNAALNFAADRLKEFYPDYAAIDAYCAAVRSLMK